MSSFVRSSMQGRLCITNGAIFRDYDAARMLSKSSQLLKDKPSKENAPPKDDSPSKEISASKDIAPSVRTAASKDVALVKEVPTSVQSFKEKPSSIMVYVKQDSAVSEASGRIQTVNEWHDEAMKKAQSYEKMPTVPMIPVLGSAWAYLPFIGKYSSRKTHKTDIEKNKHYGRVVREKMGDFEIVSSYDAETQGILTRNEGPYPSRAEFSVMKTYRLSRSQWYQPLGLMVMQGEEWREFRNRIQLYMLNGGIIQTYLNPMQAVTKDFVNLIERKLDWRNEVKDTMRLLQRWALESVAYLALDTRLGCMDLTLAKDSDGMRMINSVTTVLASINQLEESSMNYPFWKHMPEFMPTYTWRKFEKAADTFTILALNYIQFALNVYLTKGTTDPKTLLQLFLLEEKLDIKAAMVAVSDLMMAGIDTTSHTAAYLLYNLAKHQDKQDKLYKEIIRFLPNKDDKVTIEVIQQLKYFTSCLNESMRLFPVVRGNLRKLQAEAPIGGFKVPAGTNVLAVLQVVYKDPKVFQHPDEYIPERWSENSPVGRMSTLASTSFRPFGDGKRSCIGRIMATQEIATLVIELLRKYKLEYHYKDIGMVTRLLNVPDRPVRLRFIKR